MEPFQEVDCIINNAAIKYTTYVEAGIFLEYVHSHTKSDFELDYSKTKRNIRRSSGILEKEMFPLLAAVYHWRNTKQNMKEMAKVMQLLGYPTYEDTLRVRYKIENIKKRERSIARRYKSTQTSLNSENSALQGNVQESVLTADPDFSFDSDSDSDIYQPRGGNFPETIPIIFGGDDI